MMLMMMIMMMMMLQAASSSKQGNMPVKFLQEHTHTLLNHPHPRGAFGEYPIGVFVITLQPLSMSRSSDNTPSGTPNDLIAMFNAVCSTLSLAFAMSRYATCIKVKL